MRALEEARRREAEEQPAPSDSAPSDAPPGAVGPEAGAPDADAVGPDELEGVPVDVTAQIPRVLTEDDADADDVRWEGPFPPVGHVPPAASRWPAPPLSELAQGPPPPPAPPPVVAAPPEPKEDDVEEPSTPAPADLASGSTPPVSEETDDEPEGPVPVGWDHGIGDGAAVPVPPVTEVPHAEPRDDADEEGLPTLDDLLAGRPAPATGPAEMGWQATVRRLTGGLVSPRPGPAERRHRDDVASVQRTLDGPRTVVVINPKGGAQKTTATLLIAATFGMHRGGYTLAWDNNETRGTLGWRSHPAPHHSTAVDLLQDLGRFDEDRARVGDLDSYVRAQGSAQFDVLASDEDAASAASIDAYAFRSLHRTLARFYRVMVIDTGNNMRASNWQAALEAADQVVIVSTVREDTSQSAAWAVDAMRATGHADAVERAVTVLSSPAPRRDEALAARLHEHFGRLTRTVLDVPYDPALVAGGPIDYDALSRESREAWLRVTAAVADGL
nr:chromosome partitioning protein [Cellulomonas sp. APG4]